MRQARVFRVGWCEDPDCGPHIQLLDEGGKPFAEMVCNREVALALIRELQNALYIKVANR
jgi:hypothetical protein